MGIVKIEIENNEILNITGSGVTILVIDYDGDSQSHLGKPCDVTLMEHETRKETITGEFTFTRNSNN